MFHIFAHEVYFSGRYLRCFSFMGMGPGLRLMIIGSTPAGTGDDKPILTVSSNLIGMLRNVCLVLVDMPLLIVSSIFDSKMLSFYTGTSGPMSSQPSSSFRSRSSTPPR